MPQLTESFETDTEKTQDHLGLDRRYKDQAELDQQDRRTVGNEMTPDDA